MVLTIIPKGPRTLKVSFHRGQDGRPLEGKGRRCDARMGGSERQSEQRGPTVPCSPFLGAGGGLLRAPKSHTLGEGPCSNGALHLAGVVAQHEGCKHG